MREIAMVFLYLGFTGYGGPIALVGLINQEVCIKRNWVTTEEFAELFSICKLMPGPLAVQMTIYLGYKRAGRLGGLLAGAAFILPGALIILLVGFLYLNHYSRSLADSVEFMQDAALAIIALAVWELGKANLKDLGGVMVLLIAAAIVFFYPAYELMVIFGFGLLSLLHQRQLSSHKLPLVALWKFPVLNEVVCHSQAVKLFWVCLKAGGFAFGTGLAIIPLLHNDLVTNNHWLSNKEFLDGLILGQILPGPTTVSVVFFGYKVAGIYGSIISSLGFYLPAFIIGLIILPALLQRLANSNLLFNFAHWAFPAVIGGIVSASAKIAASSLLHWYDFLVFLLAIPILQRKLIPIYILIPGIGIISYLLNHFILSA